MPSHTTHLVSDFAPSGFDSETIRIGDLDGDGAPDLLYAQCIYATREITCLTAMTIHGRKLWQVGTPSPGNGMTYSDLAVQIYDWDNDGRNEVLYVRQAKYAELYNQDPARERAKRYEGNATMVVLDGSTGVEKTTFALPAPADDSFAFAALLGRGRREDLIVKDRYWNLWGISHAGEVLWHWEGSTGHYPALADVDGDGKDEVFVGYALLDHDGKVLFSHDAKGAHQDAATAVRLADGSWRLLFGNGGVHCLGLDGTLLWHRPLFEAQHVVAGKFRNDSEIQFAVINRGFPRTPEGKPAELYLYDVEGREIWRDTQPAGSWSGAIVAANWMGDGTMSILMFRLGDGKAVRLYDGSGKIVDELPWRGSGHFHAAHADLLGDSREEIILIGAEGTRIWANARALAIPTLYNNTVYTGM